MSTDYTHFDRLAFNQLFAYGRDGQENLLINSVGVFVGTLNITGNLSVSRIVTTNPSAIAASAASNAILVVGGTNNVTGATQAGIFTAMKSSTATTIYAFQAGSGVGYTGSGTLGAAVGFKSSGFSNTGSGTINRTINFDATASTTGALGNAVLSDNSAFSGNYFIHQAGTTASVFGGSISAANLSGTNTGYNVNASSSATGLMSTGTQTFAGNKTFLGTLTASNLSGTNTGNVTISTANGLSLAGQALSMAVAASGTIGVLDISSQSIGGSKSFLTGAKVGTSSLISSEIFTVHNTVTTNAASIANFFQVTANVDAAWSQGGSATTLSRHIRQITNSQTDTGTYRAGYFQNRFVVPTSMTLTNSAGRAATLTVDAPNISGGGTLAVTNFSQLFIAATSQATGTRKTGLVINTISGATNNAFISDNESYTGDYFINSTSTNPSVFSGPMTIGSTSSQQHTFNSQTGTNGAVTVSMTNAPTGVATTPKEYMQITYNGNTRYIPLIGV